MEEAEADNQDVESSQPAYLQPAVQAKNKGSMDRLVKRLAGADSQVEGSSQPPCAQPVVKTENDGQMDKVAKEEADCKNFESSQPPDVKPVVKKRNSSKAGKASGEPDLQEAVDKLIINFICDNVLPFSVVEQETFKELVTKLKPEIKVIPKSVVTNRIRKAAEDMKKNLTEELSKVTYIASTADCWLDHQKQYLGVTCHWIDEKSLEKKSASLACKRLKGSQTFDVLGPAIYKVYLQYKIEKKIVRTTTDNGSNFIKAFKSFRAQSVAEDEEDEDEEETDTDSDSGDDEEDEEDEDETDKNADSCNDKKYEDDEDGTATIAVACDDEEHELDEEETVTDAHSGDDVSELVDGVRSLEIDDDEDKKDQDTNLRGDKESSPELQLPPHQQCACHLLNLIVTEDLKKLQDEVYLRLYRAVLAKCKGIWNKVQRSHLASEEVEKTFGLKIIAPKAGRWNSTYLAFERIKRLIDEKGEEDFKGMCKKIKVEMLNSEEVAFLREYCKIMGPLVIVSKTFQSEYKIWLGSLLPKIYGLQCKFARLETSSMSYKPLIRALQDSLKRRFAQMMKDPELAAAAILLPEFKTTWTDEKDVISAGLNYVRQHVGETELNRYLKSPRKDIEVLHDFPAIKDLSLRLNTALPASAACERLFSTASKVFTSSRISSKSENLENQLLLKMNKAFRN